MKSSEKKKTKRKSFSRRYRLESSGFFRLERRVDLARLLRTTPEKLADLIDRREDLYVVRSELIGNKVRNLQIPQGLMRHCHGRILNLLRRISLPDYIRSPRRGSTAWANAARHVSSEFITAFDIKDFYPSTTEEHVFRLFHDER